jgi:pimeloyl-ACP methyl ester carboxylesterase
MTAHGLRTTVAAVLVAGSVAVTAPATGAGPRDHSPLRDQPVPEPVRVPQEPEGISLADPAFDALPGATADYGTLGGAAFQIEIPDRWSGRLVMWMHGYGELQPEANVAPPDFRQHLIANGDAWAASSYSSTSLVPQRGAEETAALWDYFVREHGRPRWTYAAGQSMGGWSSYLAAERYGDRYDGALALCGAVGTVPALRISAEYFVLGAFVAGLTQSDLDASDDVATLVDERIRPVLDAPDRRALFDRLMVELTGGPRAFAVAGIHDEEDTNFERAKVLIAAGLVPPRATPYRLSHGAEVRSSVLNEAAITVPQRDGYETFARGMEVTGDLAMPVLTMHTNGDGQTPIDQAQILRRRVEAAGRSDRLVQRVIEDPGHCGFTTGEQEAAFDALTAWVERGIRPAGTNLATADLRRLDRTFEQSSRGSDPDRARVTLEGRATVDGAPLDARWLGAVVRRDDGLLTPCNVGLPPSTNGRYRIRVYSADGSAGCGTRGAAVLLWTYVNDVKLYATTAVAWPRAHSTRADVAFDTAAPLGAAPPVTELGGEVYDQHGRRYRAGTRVDALVGSTTCGVASIRASGYYILTVAGPDSVPGCATGADVTFRVDGRAATETAVNSPDRSTHLQLTVPR